MTVMYNSINKIKPITAYVILSLVTILFILLTKYFLVTDELYYQSLGEQLSAEQIAQLLSVQSGYEYWSYILIIFLNFLKFGAISMSIYIGVLLYGLKIRFKNIFKIVVLSEFIFLLPLILKFFWFYFIQNDYTLQELQFFYPLSAINIFEVGSVSQFWMYPLQLFNLFEVMYWFLLALGIQRLIRSDYEKSLKLVLSSYLPAMLLWVVFVMFLTVTFNPA